MGESGGSDGAVIVIIDSSDEDDQIQAADLSPGFRNAAAMAGWDDEALLAAWDGEVAATPDKATAAADRGDRKRDARTPGQAVTPASLNRVHRKPRRPIDVTLERLTIHENGDRANSVQKEIDRVGEALENKKDTNDGTSQQEETSSSIKNENDTEKSKDGDAKPAYLDQLRDELSCAVCLDVCFEPSTTSCGHSFCRSCLQSAVSKCGLRCPKCRQIIKDQGAINVVLWNTIQILFPDETSKRSQAKRDEEQEETSRAAEQRCRRNLNSRRLPVDRSRPIGSYRRLAAPFRSPVPDQANMSSGGGRSGGGDLEARRQQEELDAIVASRLQEEELRSSSSTYDGLSRFHRRLRNSRARPATESNF